jgi:hypothetical protein
MELFEVLAAVAAALSLSLSMVMAAVWWGDRETSREYRERTRKLRASVAPIPPPVPVQPWPWLVPPIDGPSRRSPCPLPHGTPSRGIPLAGPYRRGR